MGIIPAVDLNDLARLGNHAVSALELAAGVPASARSAFCNLAGVPTDPTAVTLSVQKPDGTVLTYVWPILGGANGLLTRESVGRFFQDVSFDRATRWTWSLSSTGVVQSSTGDGEVWVRASAF